MKKGKTLRSLLALVTALLLIMSSTVFAAADLSSVLVVGNTAFNTEYFFNSKTEAEARANALLNADGSNAFYRFPGDTDFTGIFGGTVPAGTGLAAIKKYVSPTGTEEVVGDPEVPPTGDLEVISISAINKTTLQVVFNKVVKNVNVGNFKVLLGSNEKKIDTVKIDQTHKIVTLVVQGLNYKETVKVKVLNVESESSKIESYEEDVTIPEISEFYDLLISPAEDKILADGATKTLVTAKLINKQTNMVEDVDGIILFTTTKGQFAQGEVALQDGECSVQLTSAASDESIIAYINAVVKDAPQNREYEGIAGEAQVLFYPIGADPEEIKMVTILNAESNQADRIFLSMSGKITKKDIINSYPGEKFKDKALAAFLDGYGFRVDDNNIVKDIVEKSDTSLELILDVDNAIPTPMIEPGVLGEIKGYLRDNRTHFVTIPRNIGAALVQTSKVEFKLTDAKFPSIFGVETEGDQIIRVRFSEAMAEDQVEETVAENGHSINRHFRIDGKEIMLTAGVRATEAEKTYASLHNYILTNKLYLSADDVGEVGYIIGLNINKGEDPLAKGIDTRHIVTIILDRASRLTTGRYELQASRLGDWAGMTDPANVVQTQTFNFDAETDTSKPTVQAVVQSPEQWLIKFNQPVESINGKFSKDVFEIYIQDDYNKNPKVKLIQDTDYFIKNVSSKIWGGIEYYPYGTKISKTSVVDGQYFLVEFTKDWTVYYDTETNKVNYFTSTKNPYIVEVDYVENSVGNKMDHKKLELTLDYDGISPTIVNAIDAHELWPTTFDNGEVVFVQMSEPVKLNHDSYAPKVLPGEGLTESQRQAVTTGVPVPTYEFVKGDITINGNAQELAIDDYTFEVKPQTKLTPGEWTLYIRSISDDIGNTCATDSFKFTVEEGPAVSTDTRIAWVGFDNVKYDETAPNAGFDRIYIKFTKPMKTVGANSVGRTENYIFQGQTLPIEAEVKQGIKGVTTGWDGVTINLPRGTWDGLNGANIDFTSVLNVANNFESVDGQKLTGPYEIELMDTPNNDKLKANDYNMVFEAIYHNDSVDPLLENMIRKAEAFDKDDNGYIDEIVLSAAITAAAYDSDTKISVNGVIFVYNGAGAFIPESGKGVQGTATNNLSIKTLAGSTVIGAPFVIDKAAPVMTRATQVGSEVTFYFSEDLEATGTFDNTIFGDDNDETISVTDFTDNSIIETNPDSINGNVIVFEKGTTGFTTTRQYTNCISGGSTIIKDKPLSNPIWHAIVPPTPLDLAEAAKNIKVEIEGDTTVTNPTGVTATAVTRTKEGKAAVLETLPTLGVIGEFTFAMTTGFNNSLAGWTIELVDDGSANADGTTAVATLNQLSQTITVKGPFAATDKAGVARTATIDGPTTLEAAIQGLAAGFTALGMTDEAAEIGLVDVTGVQTAGVSQVGSVGIGTGTAASAEVLGVYEFTVTSGVTTKGVVKVVFADSDGGSGNYTTAELNVGTDATAVATAISGVLAPAGYTISSAGANVTLTQGAGKAGVTVTITIE